MSGIELQAVSVTRGGRVLLDAVGLEIADRERFVVLGPSGSGKSTLLRAIAGIEHVDAGRVHIGGTDVTRLPPRERGVSMVNQQASLQPHLDVRRNIGFPLALRRMPPAEVDERVESEARAFGFRDLLRRRPKTLSTGERHEVALARSLVHRVGVLLLDEPFANHDVPRRSSLIRELIEVQEGYGVTLLCATNDQRIALGLAHRCAVLDGGRIAQLGRPDELFARPSNAFVAGFLGTPPMNLIPGRVERTGSGARIVAGPLRARSFAPRVSDLAGTACTVGIRPTDLRRAAPDDFLVIEEPVRARAYLGAQVEVRMGGSEEQVVATIDPPVPELGSLLRLAVDPGAIHLFAADGTALTHGI